MNTDHFKKQLEAELKVVEGELKEIAVLNDETGEWEARGDKDMETMAPTQDENEFADKLEEYEEHREELPALRARFSDVKLALRKMAEGTYGICEVCDKPIEEDRLEANPAARTCKKHM
jgi:DnaK suppressor protein